MCRCLFKKEWSQFYLLYYKLTENCYCNIANCEAIPCLHLGFLLITVTPNWQEKNYRLIATFWFLFGIFVHCEMQQSWAKKTLKNFHRIYSIHFYIQQQLSVIFFYHDNLTKSIYYSLAHFRSAHLMIPWKSCGGLFLLSVI